MTQPNDLTDDALVDAYGNACLRAGKSNSGICFGASADSDWKAMQDLRTAIKDRLRLLRKDTP